MVSAIQKNIFRFFHEKYSEGKACNTKRVLKRYYINETELFHQRQDNDLRFKGLDNWSEENCSLFQLTT